MLCSRLFELQNAIINGKDGSQIIITQILLCLIIHSDHLFFTVIDQYTKVYNCDVYVYVPGLGSHVNCDFSQKSRIFLLKDFMMMVMIIFLYSHFILFSSLQFQRLKKYLSSLYLLRHLILKPFTSFFVQKMFFYVFVGNQAL